MTLGESILDEKNILDACEYYVEIGMSKIGSLLLSSSTRLISTLLSENG